MKTGPITRFCRILPFLALFTSCGGISIGIFHSTIDQSSYSGIGTFRAIVVHDPASWAALWAAHTAPLGYATLMPPPVDFSSRMVVGVFLGPRPNGCYAVRIEDIQTVPDRAIVYFSERRPDLNDVCTQAITTPAHLVTVNRTGLTFEFVKTN